MCIKFLMKIYHLITGRKKKKKKQIYKISLKERTLEIGSESRTGQKKKIHEECLGCFLSLVASFITWFMCNLCISASGLLTVAAWHVGKKD
jgi:hypothetical protein